MCVDSRGFFELGIHTVLIKKDSVQSKRKKRLANDYKELSNFYDPFSYSIKVIGIVRMVYWFHESRYPPNP